MKREKMRHLKCICLIRPVLENILALSSEITDPSFGEYYIYFTNVVEKSSIERLAEADAHEVVREVQEYFADYSAINNNFFSIPLPSGSTSSSCLYGDSSKLWNTVKLKRVSEGVCSVLLALKKKVIVRYEGNSALARKLAAEICYVMQNEGPLFDFRRPDTPPILLLLDRRNDPTTPLLNPWTYQAMIHEHLGIVNGRVDMSAVKDIREETKDIVLSVESDSFYAENMGLNLGDLGVNIKGYVDTFQHKHKSSSKIESVADMKRFVEDYPEFRKLSGNVAKHVALVGELSRKVGVDHLLEVGELEQSLAVSSSHSVDSKQLEGFLADGAISVRTKVKLVCLYALRYEKSQGPLIKTYIDALKIHGASDDDVAVCTALLQYGGSDIRLDAGSSGSVENLLATTKNVFKGLKGVENVYTQHTPRLVGIVEDLIKGKLKDAAFPYFEGSGKDKPQDIIVFMIGGATYAEAMEIEKLNNLYPGVRIIIGGTSVLNSDSFLKEVTQSVKSWTNSGKEEVQPSARPLATSERGSATNISRTAKVTF